MNKKEYPLVQLQAIELMLKKLRELASKNSDIVELVESKNLIKLKDRDQKSIFFFRVYDSKLENTQKVNFLIEYLPKNSTSSKEAENRVEDLDGVVRRFSKWVSIIQNYNKIHLTIEDEYINVYEKEIYDEFAILDDDADTMPFDSFKQEALYKYISIIENKLIEINKGQNELIDLVKESKKLKQDLSLITKNETIRRFSRLMANIKARAADAYYFVLEVTKKEIVKSLLKGGFDKIQTFIETIS